MKSRGLMAHMYYLTEEILYETRQHFLTEEMIELRKAWAEVRAELKRRRVIS